MDYQRKNAKETIHNLPKKDREKYDHFESSWFVDPEVAVCTINGKIIENEVEVRPEKVSASCLDENVFRKLSEILYSRCLDGNQESRKFTQQKPGVVLWKMH